MNDQDRYDGSRSLQWTLYTVPMYRTYLSTISPKPY